MPGTLTRWDPFTELGELRSRLDEWLDGRERAWAPAIDVVREDGHLVVRADLPGVKPEEVKIEVEDNILTISGEHSESKEKKDGNFVRRERRSGSFSRSMTLPAGVNAKDIKAKSQDGVVELTIPLRKEGQKETVKVTQTAS
jgi:HSP20 family protein